MASKKSRRRKNLRTDADYVQSAKSLSSIVPALKKLKNRKRLTRNEKRRIAYREKQLKDVPYLKPVTAQQAKRLGSKRLFKRGVRAIQLKGVTPEEKIRVNKRGDISASNADQTWIYWALPRDTVRSKRKMRTIGPAAFNKQFPIDTVAEMAIRAFKTYDVHAIYLWSHYGAVGTGHLTPEQFIMWVNEKWQHGRYVSTITNQNTGSIYENPSDPGRWVNGVAILIENPEYTKRKKELKRAKREAERAAARKKN